VSKAHHQLATQEKKKKTGEWKKLVGDGKPRLLEMCWESPL